MKRMVTKLLIGISLLGATYAITNTTVNAKTTWQKNHPSKKAGLKHFWTSNVRTVKTSKAIKAYAIGSKGAVKSKIIPKGSILKGAYSATVPGGFQISKGPEMSLWSSSDPYEWIINPWVKNVKLGKNPYNTYWIAEVKK